MELEPLNSEEKERKGLPDASREISKSKKTFNRRTALLFVYLSIFIDTLGISIFLPLLPYFAISFGASSAEVGWVFASYQISAMVSTTYMGRLSDKCGRRNSILLSIFGSAAGWLLMGFTWSLQTLVIFRAICGLFGATAPVAQAYIASSTTEEERPAYIAYVGATAGLAFLFGPGLGAGLSQFSLATPFFVSSGFAFVAFILACVYTQEPPKEKNQNGGSPKISSTHPADVEIVVGNKAKDQEVIKPSTKSDRLCVPPVFVFLSMRLLHTMGFSGVISLWAMWLSVRYESEALVAGYLSFLSP